MKTLLSDIRKCTICEEKLPLGLNPIVIANKKSKIVIVGQAPGTRVHHTSIPWNDPSGDQLRKWLKVSGKQFYDPNNFAIISMGFCYPGKGKTGDLPPRPECAPLWHKKLYNEMKNVKLVLLIGQYAQRYYLKNNTNKNLTETVRDYRTYLPQFFPLPHPSPRNRFWLKKNDWFEAEVIPDLQEIVGHICK